MPYRIIRADITNLPDSISPVDAIVNTANRNPKYGLGLDAAIFKKAGPKLEEYRKGIIGKIEEGNSVASPSFEMKDRVRKVLIHTVAPVWRGGQYKETAVLKQCYDSSFETAKRYSCESIAIPLIGSGNLGFPKTLAIKTAVNAIIDYCLENPKSMVYLVLFDKTSVEAAKLLQENIFEYIDDTGVSLSESEEYLRDDGFFAPAAVTYSVIRRAREEENRRKDTFDDILFRQDRPSGFSETLMNLIYAIDEKNAAVYDGANIKKRHFYKISGEADYKTSKETAWRFAIALKLDLEQTEAFIRRAGFVFPDPNDPIDTIVRRYIEKADFKIDKIEKELADNKLLSKRFA